MKLRNLLLTSALFLSAGIAFAGIVHDTGTADDPKNNFFWEMEVSLDSEGNPINSLNLEAHAWSNFRGDKNWNFTLYDVNNPSGENAWSSELGWTNRGVDPAELVEFYQTVDEDGNITYTDKDGNPVEDQIKGRVVKSVDRDDSIDLNGLTGETIYDEDGNPTKKVYRVGLKATSKNDSEVVFMSGDNKEIEGAQGKFYMFSQGTWVGTDKDGNEIVGAQKSIRFADQEGHAGTAIFGTPLPTPVSTLLIALGLAGAFVMYRNRKQVKA